MARVSRAAAASQRHGSGESGATIRSGSETVDLYPSINSLRSIQAQEEGNRRNCKELLMSGLRTAYNFTIASCLCVTCSNRRRRWDRLDSDSTSEDIEIASMKERLRFHFMNPFQKWNYARKRRFPFKLLVQILSIILVTLQLVLFANSKFAFTNFIQQNQATFSNLFIVNPQQPDGDDPIPNPIATLYTHEELQEQVNYTLDQYFNLDSVALGSYGYQWVEKNSLEEPPEVVLTIRKYKNSMIDPAHKVFRVTPQDITTETINITESRNDLDWTVIRSQLSQTLSITMQFEITTIFLGSLSKQINEAQCFEFTVQIEIKNDFASGSMPVVIHVDPDTTPCNQDKKNVSEIFTDGVVTTYLTDTGTAVLDSLVIFFAIISMIQCCLSLFKSWKLSRTVKVFFWMKFEYRLKFHQVLPLYNMWFIGVIISNILVLVGSTLKLIVSYSPKASSLVLVDYTSIMIGLAVFGQWSGLLRFLSYLDKYNMLLLTLRLSFPSVIRFIVCTGILYIAFLLCGWLVLGPYHPKFKDPFTTSDCLFSLINGDDMFATYIGMSTASKPAYVFSKVYLYIFIGLFIYVVLSVFISLISDTYETLHEHWYERSRGLLRDFASGKLAKAHYHTAQGHSHGHANAHIHEDDSHPDLLLDRNEEEDYEYIREASTRYMEHGGPMVFNGGPELRRSASSLDRPNSPENRERTRLRSNTDFQLPGFQIQQSHRNPT